MFPKRAVIALAATALALVLLFSFKTPDDAGLATSRGVGVRTGVGAVSTPAPTTRATRAPAATANPRSTPAPDATQAPTASPPSGGGSLADGTIDGPLIETRFGPVQVEITISGGKLADVAALALPTDHPRSLAISEYAEPILRSEALQARSAQIDLVTGATYTSVAYARSLQAALDQAHG
jgi:uncharacterized protein with FMN-binding domain